MHYGFRKDPKTGKSRLIEHDDIEVRTVDIHQPATADLGAVKKLKCSLCEKKFAAPGIFSIHFAREHKNEYEDNNSWRMFIEEVYVSDS